MSTIPSAIAPPATPLARGVRTAFVTAGPTEEPIDDVRFIGNRSSGKLGVAIVEALAARGIVVRLALGPVCLEPRLWPGISVERFRSSHDLEALLERELPKADLVVMAAAVADHRPKSFVPGKLRRGSDDLSLALEPVPDLLARTRPFRKPGSTIVGFALEPAEGLERSAREKLRRKSLDAIVANPLETMGAPDVDGTLFLAGGGVRAPGATLSKPAFAEWLAAALVGMR